MLPVVGSRLEARFSGPYEVERKISDIDYVVKTPDRRKKSHVCHVNMIKRYVVRAQTIMPSEGVVQRASPVLSVASPSYSPVEEELREPPVTVPCAHLEN